MMQVREEEGSIARGCGDEGCCRSGELIAEKKAKAEGAEGSRLKSHRTEGVEVKTDETGLKRESGRHSGRHSERGDIGGEIEKKGSDVWKGRAK
jgi:hypothetical protein